MVLSKLRIHDVLRSVSIAVLAASLGWMTAQRSSTMADDSGTPSRDAARPDLGHPTRIWTDSTGVYSVEAAFVKLHAGKVTLRRSDGKAVELPLERLSKADRNWIERGAQERGTPLPVVDEAPGDSSETVDETAAAQPTTLTLSALRKTFIAFSRRLHREEYLRAGKKDPAWDETVLRLFDAVAMIDAKRHAEPWHIFPAPTLDDLRMLCVEAREAGCDDPLVFLIHATLLHAREWDAAVCQTAVRMLETMRGQGYSSLHVALLAEQVCKHASEQSRGIEALDDEEKYLEVLRRNASGNRPELAILLRHMVETACDPGYSATERRFVFGDLCRIAREMPIVVEPLQDVLETRSDVDPWLKAMFLGQLELSQGQQAARPGAWAEISGEVARDPKPCWQRARNHFTNAWKLQPQCPEAAGAMMRLILAGGSEREDTMRGWFDRAVSAQFDWTPAYTLMRQDLVNRCDVDGLYAFGTECLRTGRYDTSVPFKFIVILEDIMRITQSHAFLKRPDVYRDVREFFRGNAANSDHKDMALFTSLEAMYACLAGEYDDARQAFERVGAQLDREMFKRFRLDPDMEIARAFAGTGPFQGEIEAMEKMAGAGQLAKAAEACQTLLAKVGGSDPARAYLRHRAVALDLEAKFATGDWVPLPADRDLAGWNPISGEWAVDSNGALVGKSVIRDVRDLRGAMLLTMARIGNRFEIEGHAELLSNSGGYGAVISYCGMQSYWECSFHRRKSGKRGEAYVMCAAHRNPHPRPAEVELANDFRIQVYDGRVATMVGAETQRDFVPFVVHLDHDYPTDATPFGLACARGMPNDAVITVRFTKLRIRKMTAPPKQLQVPEPE